MTRIINYIWPSPVTLLGLLLAIVGFPFGGSLQFRDGVFEAWGGVMGWWLKGGRFFRGGAAVALGHVILARDLDCLNHSRGHELFHVRQYERWGVFLPPIYWLVAAWLWLRGYHPYLDHPFEPPPE